MAYTVELEGGVWLDDGEGDPPRTLVESSALEFDTFEAALSALNDARKYRKFEGAQITISDPFS